MKVQVRLNNYRRSARKVREIVPVVKGLSVTEAESQLSVLEKGSAEDLKKLLLSGVAAAKNNFGLNERDLVLENIIVQEGRTLKRWRARAYGRANQILKRTCHIVLTVAEKDVKVSGKDFEKSSKKKVEGNKAGKKKSVNQKKDGADGKKEVKKAVKKKDDEVKKSKSVTKSDNKKEKKEKVNKK